MSEELDITQAGMSRRTLIKRSAIAGGLVWAAPAVTSMSPAFAVGTPEGKDFSYIAFFYTCTTGTFGIKYELNDDGTVQSCAGDDSPIQTPQCGVNDQLVWAGAGAGDCHHFSLVTHADGSVTVTFIGSGTCTFHGSVGVGKCGNPENPNSGGACVTGVPSLDGQSLFFDVCGA